MRITSFTYLNAVLAALAAVRPAVARAQRWPAAQGAADSLHLAALQADALRTDPRARQLALQATATDLRLRNIAAEELPALSLNGQQQYQSAVTTIAVPLPGASFPTPPHNTYDARLNAQQSLYDPSIRPRRVEERAQLVEAQAQIRTALYPLRQEVNDAFFGALAAQLREDVTTAAMQDLDARLREAATQFRDGAALPGDTAEFAASLLQRRQDLLQARADRAAALARLSDLVGRPVTNAEPLAVPHLAVAAEEALRSLEELRARPEYAQFAATRVRLAAQEAEQSAQERPKVSAFGRVGYGRPGLNLLSPNFQSYWLAGVQVQWTPWTWGTVERDRQALEVQRQIATTNEEAFTSTLQRGVQQSIATMARLDTTLALDDRIVALRTTVDEENKAKLHEGAITAASYLDRYTELETARLARAQHSVELEQARATFLTTLGVEVP